MQLTSHVRVRIHECCSLNQLTDTIYRCVWICEHYLLRPDQAQPLIDHLLAARALSEDVSECDSSTVLSRALLQVVPACHVSTA